MAKRQTHNDSSPTVEQLLERIAALETENQRLKAVSPTPLFIMPDTDAGFDPDIASFKAYPDTTIIAVSAAFTKLSGYTVGDQTPLKLSEAFSLYTKPSDLTLAALFDDAFTYGIRQCSGLLQRRDGGTTPVCMAIWPSIDHSGDVSPSITGMMFDLSSDISPLTAPFQEQDSKYTALLEHSQIGVTILQDFRFVYANQTFSAMSGFPVEEILTQSPETIYDHIHPDDREMVWSRLEARLSGKDEPERYEFRIIRKKGELCWVELTVNQITYHGRQALFQTMTDITERKLAEQAVLDSEKRLTQIIQGNSIASFVIDEHHLVTHWNRACEALTGIAASDVIGTNRQWIAFYPNERPVLADMVLDHRTDKEISELYHRFSQRSPLFEGAFEAEDFFSHLGPQGKWLYFTAAPLVDATGRSIGAIETLQDITERKFQEQAVRESEERIRAIINSSQDGIVIITRTGTYIESNSAFQRLVGYSAEELLHMSFYEITPEKWHAKEEGFLTQIERDGHGSFEKEYRSKDGTLIPVIVNCWKIPGTDPHGGYIGGFVRDLSREQHMEMRLRQTQKMEAIGTLAAGIAHDFNNALTAILLNTELLLSDHENEDFDYPLLTDIHTSGMRAKELVEQILTFSRQSSQDHTSISLSPIIKESLKILRASIPTTIEIVLDIDESVKSVNGNPTQMHQVIINLMSNAAHAMQDSGGTLTLALHPRIFSQTESHEPELPPGRYVELIVSDTGHGMDQVIAERIFEPFFTTKGPGEGTGMGLSVVHGIVTSMGGYITLNSEPNKGTSFHILLPELDSTERTGDAAAREHLDGSERILLIDDEPAIIKIARLTLERLGYTVDSYNSSEQALDAFRNHPDDYDVIITDLTMPGITGIELTTLIKQVNPAVPIIVCSGYNEAFENRDPSDFGIAATVKKPFSKETLASAIRTILDTRTD